MSSWEPELLQILAKERSLLRRICGLSEWKTGALKSGDVDKINFVIGKEQPIILQLKTHEAERIALLKENGLEDLQLSKVEEHASEEYKERFHIALETLSSVAEKLKSINSLNNKLTESRLELYARLRTAIEKPMYSQSGKEQKTATVSRLINKKV